LREHFDHIQRSYKNEEPDGTSICIAKPTRAQKISQLRVEIERLQELETLKRSELMIEEREEALEVKLSVCEETRTTIEKVKDEMEKLRVESASKSLAVKDAHQVLKQYWIKKQAESKVNSTAEEIAKLKAVIEQEKKKTKAAQDFCDTAAKEAVAEERKHLSEPGAFMVFTIKRDTC
jgi:hypothetical protein